MKADMDGAKHRGETSPEGLGFSLESSAKRKKNNCPAIAMASSKKQ